MNKLRQRAAYMLGDWAASSLAIVLYYACRYHLLDQNMAAYGFGSVEAYLRADMVVAGMICFPIGMVAIYWLSGFYNDVFRKSYLQEGAATFMSTLAGTFMVYFVAQINDNLQSRFQNYEILLVLWFLLMLCVYPLRLYITHSVKRRIARSQVEFVTLVVGTSHKARKCAAELQRLKGKLGYKVIGFVAEENSEPSRQMQLPVYHLDEMEEVCRQHRVSELVIAPQSSQPQSLMNLLSRLYPLNLPIKMMADDASVFMPRGRMVTVYGAPLIDITGSRMSDFEINLKRAIDVIISIIAILLLTPILAIFALIIKISSPAGPVIFKQQRVGLRGKEFTIYKLRTMVADAEADGRPQLTTDGDKRVLPIGHFMRKYRIDELPQFWNVLRGDMSIVGPRPERRHFIEQIQQRAPQYTMLLQVRPGITSFGMVKYGYASSVDAMVERMKYDLLYLDNMSLVSDLKVAAYTVWTVITGKGL